MRYKAVISDLDGTLLNDEHKISDYTKSVIKAIMDKGIKFFIATGRHHIDVFSIKKNLELNTISITSNGARVHDENNQEIVSRDLPLEISNDIINLKVCDDIHINAYAGDIWYAEKEASWMESFHTESGFSCILKPFKELKNTKITKFFYVYDDHSKLLELEKKFLEKYPGKINTTMPLPSCLEIMEKNTTKGVAISEVLKKEGILLEEAIAFGDGLNDIEMLDIVGEGFIMENGSETLKKKLPHLEVVGKNSEDGVAKKLAEIFNIHID